MNFKEEQLQSLSRILESMAYQQVEELFKFIKDDPACLKFSDADRDIAIEFFVTGFIKAGLITFDTFAEILGYQEALDNFGKVNKEDLN